MDEIRDKFESDIDYLDLDFTREHDGYKEYETRKIFAVYQIGVSVGKQGELINQINDLPKYLRFQAP